MTMVVVLMFVVTVTAAAAAAHAEDDAGTVCNSISCVFYTKLSQHEP
jgi:hypothetical protein